MKFIKYALYAAYAACIIPSAWGQPPATAEVKLLSIAPKLPENGKVRVGIYMKIAPEMHIYWKNTGADTGMPTTVKWELPDGVKAGNLQWPTPVTFKNADETTGIGYENEVAVFSDLDFSANKDAAQKPIIANIRWLACKDDSCVPGKAKVELDLKTNQADAAASEEILKKFENRLAAAKAPDNVKSTFSNGKLSLEAPGLTTAVFYPETSGQAPIGPVKADSSGKVSLDKVSGEGIVKLTINNESKSFMGKF